MFLRLIRSVLALGSLAWLARQLFANRGLMSFIPDVEIFEPQQRALLAWNGDEELLVLGTDLHASRPTRVLEVLPLPAEPVVARGDPLIFDKLEALIRRNLVSAPHGPAVRGGDMAKAAPAGEVTQRKHIGAHDISVIHLLDPAGFVGWVEGYLASLGAEMPTIPAAMAEIVRQYIAEGFSWFAFDVVSLGETIATNDPIQYRFRSSKLFYPMRITKLAQGETSVGLYILTQTRTRLGQFAGIPRSRVRSRLGEIAGTDAVRLLDYDVMGLGTDIADLFGLRAGDEGTNVHPWTRVAQMELRAWQLEGRLASFDADLVVERFKKIPRRQRLRDPAMLIERWLADPTSCDPAEWDKAAVLPVLEARLIDAWEHSRAGERAALFELRRALFDEYAS